MIVTPAAPESPLEDSKYRYRFRRGSKLADMPPVPPDAPVPPLSELNGPFQLAEFLALKVRADPHNVPALVDPPADIKKADERHVWVYEHLRRIPIDVTPLVTQLLQLCSRETCPEMKADVWQYLCVAHGGDGTDQCCAIDYILHTLDSTSSLLNSTKYFPSRLHIPNSSLSHFPSLFRRLSRIFSHAYFHHREAFATSEAETSLYRRFVALCTRYELVGPSLLIIPQEGYEGIVMAEEDDNIDINARETADNDNDSDEDDDHTHDHATEQEIKDHEEIAAAGAGEDKEEPLVDGDAERGRAADSATLATSQAAGRHASISPSKWTPMQPPTKSKPAPAQESTTQSPPSTRAQLDMSDEPVIPTTVQGRGTLSRGKGSRGSAANVWAQAAAASATEAPTTVPEATDAEDVPPSVLGMARKESAESVVLVPTTVDDAENTESAPAATSTSTPPRTPSPDRTILKLETQLLPVNETTEAQTPDALATPVPTDPATTVPSITQDTEDDVETTTTLDVEPSIPSPSSSPKPPTTTTTESDASALASSPAKSTLNVARSEVLISPKSELLPLASPKNELLSVSPKSPGKRRGGGNRPKPKSPNSKSKSPSPSPSPRKLDASEDE